MCNSVKLSSTFFVCAFTLSLTELNPQLLPNEMNLYVYVGYTIDFECYTTNPGYDLIWNVGDINGAFGSTPYGEGKKIFLAYTVLSTTKNNTEAQCIAIKDDERYDSNTATIIIQGTLDQIKNVSHNMIDRCSAKISWDPPFSLPIPILGYNISITLYRTNELQETAFINETTYELPPLFLNETYIVGIAAFNPAGDGKVVQVTVNFTLSQEFRAKHTLRKVDSVWVIEFLVPPSSHCTATKHIENVKVSSCDKESYECIVDDIVQTGNVSQHLLLDNNLKVIARQQLQEDRYFETSLVTYYGDFQELTSMTIELSTYDVQNVTVDKNDGGICIMVTFVNGSTSSGCYIELQCDHSTVSHYLIYKEGKETEINNCKDIAVTTKKFCLLSAFDYENNERSNTPAVPLINVVINPTTPSSELQTPTPSVSTTVIDDALDDNTTIIVSTAPIIIIITIIGTVLIIITFVVAVFVVIAVVLVAQRQRKRKASKASGDVATENIGIKLKHISQTSRSTTQQSITSHPSQVPDENIDSETSLSIPHQV